MADRVIAPAITLSRFNCAHCGAFTHHDWFRVLSTVIDNGGHPAISIGNDWIQNALSDPKTPDDIKRNLVDFANRLGSGDLWREAQGQSESGRQIHNLNLSACFSCQAISVWRHNDLIYPQSMLSVEPNIDMPSDIIADFKEARNVFASSPRASAALLRLCVQKLCAVLGEPGHNINDDVASLVKKGLSPRVQQALDTVRVIGNEAVHPGTLDLNDDRELASSLFDLVNLIVEEMISRPIHVAAMYDKLPQSKRDGIVKRDTPKG